MIGQPLSMQAHAFMVATIERASVDADRASFIPENLRSTHVIIMFCPMNEGAHDGH